MMSGMVVTYQESEIPIKKEESERTISKKYTEKI